MNNDVLITGAGGNIGRTLIKKLLAQTSCTVHAVDFDKDIIHKALEAAGINDRGRVKALSNDEFFAGAYASLESFDVVHLAFSRRNRSNAEIAGSIDFARKVFEKTKELGAGRLIYMSSQGVYGNCEEIRTEMTVPAPGSQYTMAKYAAEKVLEAIYPDPAGRVACIRLDSVVQSQNLVIALCGQAKNEGVLRLKGGSQRFSYIDLEDAASAVVSLLSFDGEWKPIYNVGLNDGRITLVELAQRIAAYSEKVNGVPVKIELDEQPIEIWSGMDASLFMNDTGWRPEYGIDDMIAHIYDNE